MRHATARAPGRASPLDRGQPQAHPGRSRDERIARAASTLHFRNGCGAIARRLAPARADQSTVSVDLLRAHVGLGNAGDLMGMLGGLLGKS